MTEGARRDWWCGSQRSTPHLTSPLEGGRDELGRRGECWVGGGRGEMPAASAGMTGRGVVECAISVNTP